MRDFALNKCQYELVDGDYPPCTIFSHNKYKNINAFLSNEDSTQSKKESLPLQLDCIKFDRKVESMNILTSNCIGCTACLVLCPGNKINITKGLIAESSCSNTFSRTSQEVEIITNNFINFTGTRLESKNTNYSSFEEFTSVNETSNISIWAGIMLQFIFGDRAKLGLEINFPIKGRDRDGRLDICVIDDETILLIESKISLTKLISEKRYVAQILSYEEEMKELLANQNKNFNFIKLLLIGGDETDLLPPDHELCTSKVGNLGMIFYGSLMKTGIQFISSRALLSLAMKKIINKNDDINAVLIGIFSNSKNIGLVSNLIVEADDNKFNLIPY